MFTPETWVILSQELTDRFGALEDELLLELTNKISKGNQLTLEEWRRLQDDTDGAYRRKINKIIRKRSKEIDKVLKDTINRALEISQKAVAEEVKDLNIDDKRIKLTEREKAVIVKKTYDWQKENYNVLYQQAFIKNNQIKNKITTDVAFTRVSAGDRAKPLIDAISRVLIQDGADKGLDVYYRNGTRRSFRSYIEMATRTEMQNIATETMERATNRLGIIFFLASEHSDCADDHAPYQGRLYVNENWQEYIDSNEERQRIQNFINRRNIRTMQWVKGEPVYFTTRPNCRHHFIPLTIEQATGSMKDLKEQFKIQPARNVKRNYRDLEQQRYNERQIRKYKTRVETLEVAKGNTTNQEAQNLIEAQIQHNNRKKNEWFKRQRELLATNRTLKRQRRREAIDKFARYYGADRD